MNPEKPTVYNEFQRVVKEIQHSDVCYVLTELMELYSDAIKKAQTEQSAKITLIFPKQHVQINMGCNLNYYSGKRPRRIPDEVKYDKNHIFPEVLNDWHSLTPKAQDEWKKRMTEQGIIPPSTHTRIRRAVKKFWKNIRRIV